MPSPHYDMKPVKRSAGRSLIAHAAYIGTRRMEDERSGKTHDYSKKHASDHTEILLPEGAPAWMQDAGRLWNAVEGHERRKDAQLARQIILALPNNLSPRGQVEAVRTHLDEVFVSKGMIAEFAIHRDNPDNQHAHVILTMREVGPDGFRLKNRDWNKKELLLEARKGWERVANQALEREGLEEKVCLDSYKTQGLSIQPQPKLGIPKALAEQLRGLDDGERKWKIRASGYGKRAGAIEAACELQQARLRANGDIFLGRPGEAARAISKERATFTERQLRNFLKARMDVERVPIALEGVLASNLVLVAGRDSEGEKRFVARSFAQLEQKLVGHAEGLARSNRHRVPVRTQARVAKKSTMSAEQEAAFRHLTGDRDLAVVQGYAGAGKSFLLGEARKAWVRNGQKVKGVTLAAKAAASLSRESGIDSRTIDSALLSHGFFEAGMILVIDEAGMVGTEHMEKLLARAREARAKVVMVGDREQLAAVAGGRPMDIAGEVAGEIRLGEVRRQKVAWQRVATMAFGDGRARDALAAYDAHGHFHRHAESGKAVEDLISRWSGRAFGSSNGAAPTQLMLAFRNTEVDALNRLARELMIENGKIGASEAFTTHKGARVFGEGDRILFEKNDRALGVKNGNLGTVLGVEPCGLKVRLDSGDEVVIDPRRYKEFDWGYAGTIHRSQGDTVDFVEVLASSGFDRHLAYVAMSRHRYGVEVHYSGEEFQSKSELFDALSKRDARLNVRDLAVEPEVQDEIFSRLSVLPDSELAAEIVDAEDRLSARGPRPEASAARSKNVAALEGRVAELGELRDKALEEVGVAAGKGDEAGARAAQKRAAQQFDRREPLIQELETLRRESRAYEAELAAHQGDIRQRRVVEAEIAIGRSIETERTVAILQRRLSELEIEYGAAASRWIELDRAEPEVAASARTGRDADSYRDFRVLEREVNDLRWELGGLRGLNGDWRIETDRELPASVEVARVAYDEAAVRFSTAEAAWAQAFGEHGQTGEVEAARNGRGALASTYTELVQASRERTLAERHLRVVEVEQALSAAEDRWLVAVKAWTNFRDLASEEAKWAFTGEGPAAAAYEAERAAIGELRRLSNLHDGLVGRGRLQGPQLPPPSVGVAEAKAVAALEAWKAVRGEEAGVAQRRQPAGDREVLYQQAREAASELARARASEARVRSFERLASMEAALVHAARASETDELYRACGAWSKAVERVERYAEAAAPVIHPVPVASDERYAASRERFGAAAAAWAEISESEPQLVEARVDGRLVCAEYLAFRAAAAELSVHEQARAVERVEARLERAESAHRNAVEALRDGKVYANDEAVRFAYLGQGELGSLYKAAESAAKTRRKLEKEFDGLRGAKSSVSPKGAPKAPVVVAEANEAQLVARWHAFRQFHAGEVLAARRGEGPGAGLYAQYREGAVVAHEARKSAYEERVFGDIHRLEGRAFVAEGRWSTFCALSPKQVGGAWRGEGQGARLLDEKRVAERQLFVAEQSADRALGRSLDAVKARALDENAVRRWHEVRLANPEVAAEAREGKGPQAAAYIAYRETRIAAEKHRHELKAQRIEKLLERADAMETRRHEALSELLLARSGGRVSKEHRASAVLSPEEQTPAQREAALYAAVQAFPEDVPKAAEAFLDGAGTLGSKRIASDLDGAASAWQRFVRTNDEGVVEAARRGEGEGVELYRDLASAAREVAWEKRFDARVKDAVFARVSNQEHVFETRFEAAERLLESDTASAIETRLAGAKVTEAFVDVMERRAEAGLSSSERGFDDGRQLSDLLGRVEASSLKRDLQRAESAVFEALDLKGETAEVERDLRMEELANALGRHDRTFGVPSVVAVGSEHEGDGHVYVWRAFKESAEHAEVEAARNGEGAGAEYYLGVRAELRARHAAAYEAGRQAAGVGDIEAVGNGDLARAAQAFSRANRELESVEAQLARHGRIPGAPTQSPTSAQIEVPRAPEQALREASIRWEQYKAAHSAAEIATARNGAGPGAEAYLGVRQAQEARRAAERTGAADVKLVRASDVLARREADYARALEERLDWSRKKPILAADVDDGSRPATTAVASERKAASALAKARAEFGGLRGDGAKPVEAVKKIGKEHRSVRLERLEAAKAWESEKEGKSPEVVLEARQQGDAGKLEHAEKRHEAVEKRMAELRVERKKERDRGPTLER